ncbi:MAG: hypothetical protein KA144_09570 [Xanthomonadaceae bacterium]|nr:hypothetical protein [Xanthomonadaceae bacterium]
MQLFRTEMIHFHPPQRPLAYRLRGGRLRYGCRAARPRLAPPDALAEAACFPAPEAIVVDADATPAMDRAA